jgi:hypothetical protein
MRRMRRRGREVEGGGEGRGKRWRGKGLQCPAVIEIHLTMPEFGISQGGEVASCCSWNGESYMQQKGRSVMCPFARVCISLTHSVHLPIHPSILVSAPQSIHVSPISIHPSCSAGNRRCSGIFASAPRPNPSYLIYKNQHCLDLQGGRAPARPARPTRNRHPQRPRLLSATLWLRIGRDQGEVVAARWIFREARHALVGDIKRQEDAILEG